MSDNNPRPIAKFFATILHLALTVIVISVVIAMATARHNGEDLNPVEAIAKTTHQAWVDLKKGWSE
jgi:hypothetical protein